MVTKEANGSEHPAAPEKLQSSSISGALHSTLRHAIVWSSDTEKGVDVLREASTPQIPALDAVTPEDGLSTVENR